MSLRSRRKGNWAPDDKDRTQMDLIQKAALADAQARSRSTIAPARDAAADRSGAALDVRAEEALERADVLRTTREAALYLGLRPGTLHKWRVLGSHLPFVKFGGAKGHIRYRQRDLDLFIEKSTRRSTSEPSSKSGDDRVRARRSRP